MFKSILLTCALFSCNILFANELLQLEENRTFLYSKEEQIAKVHIKDAPGAVAAVFNDGQENQLFLEHLLSDNRSSLYLAARNLELEICGFNSIHFEWIEGCGQISLSTPVETHFNHSSLKSSRSGYTFFLGFIEDSPEVKMEPYYVAKINETIQVFDNEEYNILKSLEISHFKKYQE